MTQTQSIKFPAHTGGVIQVAHSGRWGAVPESLLEDKRLSLDTRAIAAWLAIKSNGWQVCVAALRKANGQGKKILGEHKWLRIAQELEDAGYFSRLRKHGEKGQWLWHITFTPVPGLSMDGSPMHGTATHGKAVYIPTPQKPSLSLPTPQQLPDIQDLGIGESELGSCCASELVFPKISEEEKDVIVKLIQAIAIDKKIKQELLDELSGAILKNSIQKGNVPFFRSLIKAKNEERFVPNLGIAVLAARNSAKSRDKEKQSQRAKFENDLAASAKGEEIMTKSRKDNKRREGIAQNESI